METPILNVKFESKTVLSESIPGNGTKVKNKDIKLSNRLVKRLKKQLKNDYDGI